VLARSDLNTMSSKNYKVYDFKQSPLYCLKSKKKLASLFGLNLNQLNNLLKSELIYSEYERTDPETGKKRFVEAPRGPLVAVQSKLDTFLSRIEVPCFLHSPAKNRSQLTNANVHRESKTMMKLDIKSYFPSTPSRRIYYFFHKILKCSPDVAAILTKLSTHNNHLPTGSPSSPRLAYFAYMEMWEEVYEVATSIGYLMTVYIDDITISGECISRTLLWAVKKKIYSYGLKYHKTKNYCSQPFEVTGVVISGKKTVAPNRHHKKIHTLKSKLYQECDMENKEVIKRKLQGCEAYLHHVTTNN
jgi:retron-type reverse transcriptase